MLHFLSSTVADIDSLQEILTGAIAFMASHGVNQWQCGYPNRDSLLTDVASGAGRLILDDTLSQTSPVALCALYLGEEESYRSLQGGGWLNTSGSYLTIHRVAVRDGLRGRGYAGFLFSAAEEEARRLGADSVRIDTHPDNQAMQRALDRAGYTLCGRITLTSGPEAGTPRLGYEKLLSSRRA